MSFALSASPCKRYSRFVAACKVGPNLVMFVPAFKDRIGSLGLFLALFLTVTSSAELSLGATYSPKDMPSALPLSVRSTCTVVIVLGNVSQGRWTTRYRAPKQESTTLLRWGSPSWVRRSRATVPSGTSSNQLQQTTSKRESSNLSPKRTR